PVSQSQRPLPVPTIRKSGKQAPPLLPNSAACSWPILCAPATPDCSPHTSAHRPCSRPPAHAAKRKAAEKVLAAQRKAWESREAVFDKAAASGVPASTNPLPGLEPKLEDILVETERERLFDIIRGLVKWENSNDERVLNKARAEILRST